MVDEEDFFECDILNYLISRIHEEDTEKGIEHIGEKINMTEQILLNRELLVNAEDFYEEECQFSLLNWVYDLYSSKEVVSAQDKKNLEILLNNILVILEIFPIKPMDLISLNFIRKLNKIKHSLKYSNIVLYQKIKSLTTYWTQILNFYQSQVSSSSSNFLTAKRKREEPDILEVALQQSKKDDDFSSLSSKSNLSTISDDSKYSKKKVSWLDDQFLVTIVEYPKEE